MDDLAGKILHAVPLWNVGYPVAAGRNDDVAGGPRACISLNHPVAACERDFSSVDVVLDRQGVVPDE